MDAIKPNGQRRMPEQIKYPTEQKIDTAQRVTYNAEVTKYYDRRESIRIMVRDLTDEKLFKLLRDIIGKDGAE